MDHSAYLVETCLLTHGLVSVDNAMMADAWDIPEARLCWVDKGVLTVGHIDEFLSFRAGRPHGKFDMNMLDAAISEGLSGALTASATMEVCRRMAIPYAVSCGIGGIGEIKGEELCPDLPALRDLPVTLICTSPKDMLDIPATFRWLKDAGVSVVGDGGSVCTGYLFHSVSQPLDGVWEKGRAAKLILRGIPGEMRLSDLSLLEQAVAEAKEAERQGGYYHPTANAALDRLSQGHSSRIQLRSLLDNIRFAANI